MGTETIDLENAPEYPRAFDIEPETIDLDNAPSLPRTENPPTDPSTEAAPLPQRQRTTRRRTTRSAAIPPLLPHDPDFETLKITLNLPPMTISDFRKLAHPAELREYTSVATGEYCFDNFDKEEVGGVVLGWMEEVTGEREVGVVGWEVEEEEGKGWYVLRAVGED